jgi:hypothetical protein
MNSINILIPYRNREEDLKKLLPTLRESLDFLNLTPFFIVSEQTNDQPFNKGAVFNAGFKEGLKFKKSNYWILHDVDIFEKTPGLLNYCQADGVSSVFTHDINTCPGGGITCINEESFKKINGFTNEFWHWGLEDNDFKQRVAAVKIPILHSEKVFYKSPGFQKRNPNQKIWSEVVLHSATPKTDKREKKIDKNQNNLFRKFIQGYKKDPNSVMNDGLSNVNYELINKNILAEDVVKFTVKILNE